VALTMPHFLANGVPLAPYQLISKHPLLGGANVKGFE